MKTINNTNSINIAILEYLEEQVNTKTFHHYTKSEWADGAALYIINNISLPVGSELIIINKELEAWNSYTIEENGDVFGSNWTYAPLPDDIGTSVWDI